MIKYIHDSNNPQKTVVNVTVNDISNMSDLEEIIIEMHVMCQAVINCLAVRYIQDDRQDVFTDILRKLLADMLAENKTGLDTFKLLKNM